MAEFSQKTKILYLITKMTWGGAQRYVYDLATNMPRARFDVACAGGESGMLKEKLAQSGVRTHTIAAMQRDIAMRKEFRSFFSLFSILKKEQPDIIHLNSNKMIALGALASGLALGLNKPRPRIIATIHGWAFLEPRNYFSRALLWCASWIGAMLCDTVICINQSDFRIAGQMLPRKKLTLIPNGIQPGEYLSKESARQSLAAHCGISFAPQTTVIGAIAELTKNKNIKGLIDAFAHMDARGTTKTYQAIILGDGERAQEIKQDIIRRNLHQKIFLAGFVPDASRMIPAFDFFILPSHKEGLPYVLMEAMGARVPVAASMIGGIPDLITHNQEGILIQSTASAHIADALLRLFSLPDKEKKQMTDRAYEKLMRFFSFDAMMRATISLYENQRKNQ